MSKYIKAFNCDLPQELIEVERTSDKITISLPCGMYQKPRLIERVLYKEVTDDICPRYFARYDNSWCKVSISHGSIWQIDL